MQEQQAEPKRQREDDADRHVAIADALTERAHYDPGCEGEGEQAPQRREADQTGAGRAGKADMRQRVAGESLPAHHQEITDKAGHHRNDAGGGERIGHEFVGKHVSDDGVGRARDHGRDGRAE